jgi:hypothetical protein
VSDAPAYSFHDAGLHSRPLRILNVCGAALRRLGAEPPSLEPDALIDAARRSSGLADLGADTLREPLEVLADAIRREAGLTTFGRIALRGLLVGALENRLALVDWTNRHPEVRAETITRPWIIVGLPRTGTTLLSLLLALDPQVRPLEQWEASRPIPPPDLASHREDPRIESARRTFAQLESLNPPIRAMHPFGATLATECVTLLIFDLRSLSIETQAFVPSYGRWLEQADMSHAYELHELALKALQSRIPTGAWSLKTPNHLWCLDELVRRYPDARILWTHRDPTKVVPSVASLNCAMQRAFARRVEPRAVAADWNHKLHLAVTRGLDFDARQNGRAWCHHVQYAQLLTNPLGTLRNAYAHFGDTLTPLHERRIEAWLRERPQNVHGRHVYEIADFGLTAQEIAEAYAAYSRRFDVPPEAA